MSIESQHEREERYIQEQYERGEISLAEYNKAMRDLQRDARDEIRAQAEQAAQDAYNDVMGGGW